MDFNKFELSPTLMPMITKLVSLRVSNADLGTQAFGTNASVDALAAIAMVEAKFDAVMMILMDEKKITEDSFNSYMKKSLTQSIKGTLQVRERILEKINSIKKQ